MVTASNLKYFQFIAEDSEINLLEKSNPVGAVTKEDISDALAEYEQQFRIGQISKAELLTLHRAYPSNQEYAQAALQKGIIGDEDSPAVVVGGPASVEMVDREGHLITMQAMQKAFDKFMSNNRTRNVMVLHSDVQVGWALPAYINSSGQIFKSGVNDDRLFLLSEIRDDTKISQRVVKQIEDGKLHSYSIAGSAIQTQTIQKGMMQYMQVDELELAEITVCEQGVNQGANFDILKGHAYTGTCIDGSCLIPLEKDNTPFKMEELELIFKEDGSIDFFDTLIQKLDDEDVEIPRGKNVNSEDDEHDGDFLEKILGMGKKNKIDYDALEEHGKKMKADVDAAHAKIDRITEKLQDSSSTAHPSTTRSKTFNDIKNKLNAARAEKGTSEPAQTTTPKVSEPSTSVAGDFVEKIRKLYKQEEGEQLPLPGKISQQSFKDHVRDAYSKFTGAGKHGKTADAPSASVTPHAYSTDKEIMERGKGENPGGAKGWKAHQRAAGDEYDKDVSMSKAEEASEKPNKSSFELKPKLPKGTEGGGTRASGEFDEVKPKVPMHPNVLRRIRDKYTDQASKEGRKAKIWTSPGTNGEVKNIEKAGWNWKDAPKDKPKNPGGSSEPTNKELNRRFNAAQEERRAKGPMNPGGGSPTPKPETDIEKAESDGPLSHQSFKDHVQDKYKDFTAPGASDGPPSMLDALRESLGHPPKDKSKLESNKGWKTSARGARNEYVRDVAQTASKQPKPETDMEKSSDGDFIQNLKALLKEGGGGGGGAGGNGGGFSGTPATVESSKFSATYGGNGKKKKFVKMSNDTDPQLFKEDPVADVLSAVLASLGGPLAGHSFVGLQNEGGRRELHSHFTRELGFPEEVHEDTMRYSPVSEENPSAPWKRMAPWKVNEAGSEMHMPIDTPSHGDVAPLAHNQVGMTKSAVDSFIEWETDDN